MMKKKYIVGWGLATALMVAPAAAFAAGFANTAQSATASGMSGVATGNADEPNANFYNPASMIFREDFNVYAGPTLIAPSVSYTSPDGTSEASTVAQVFPPPNFSLAVPFADSFALGVGVTLPWGLAIDWDNWENRETFRSQGLQTININPNFAYKIPGLDLGVAAGVQVLHSTLSQRRSVFLREDTEVDVNLAGSGVGVGGTFAAMFKATDEITLGLNYRSGARINYEGTARFGNHNDEEQFTDPNDTPFAASFVDQDITTTINIPHTVNFGLGWQVLEPLWLGVDVNYMTWSVYDEIAVEFEEQGDDLVVNADWEDAFAFRIGGEFAVIDNLKARAGFGYDMTPVPDETVGPSLPDNDRFVFSTGVGYTKLGIRADLAYQFVYLNERVIDNEVGADGTYQLSSHLVGINIGYGF